MSCLHAHTCIHSQCTQAYMPCTRCMCTNKTWYVCIHLCVCVRACACLSVGSHLYRVFYHQEMDHMYTFIRPLSWWIQPQLSLHTPKYLVPWSILWTLSTCTCICSSPGYRFDLIKTYIIFCANEGILKKIVCAFNHEVDTCTCLPSKQSKLFM